MDWLILLGLGIIVSMVVLIGLLLSSLAKQGDERKQLIKSKSMSQTFAVVIGILIIKSGQSLYKEIWSGQWSRRDEAIFFSGDYFHYVFCCTPF